MSALASNVLIRDCEQLLVNVPCYRIDSLRPFIRGRVGLIKIDVEGFELDVLRGAVQTLENDRPIIIFEYNVDIASPAGWTIEDAHKIIGEMGYSLSVMVDGDREQPLPSMSDRRGILNVVGRPISN